MAFYLVIFGIMIVFSCSLLTLDWLSCRQERRRLADLALASGALDQLADEARRLGRGRSRKEAVTEALIEYIQRRK